MSEGTPVKCLECGHEWETVADYPQCSDPNDECGRSRNVEPIHEVNGGAGASSERDPEPSGDSQSQSEWSPLFETQETESEPVEDMSFSEPPEVDGSEGFKAEEEPGHEPESEDVELPELEPEDIELFVKTPFDIASRSRGDHWELSDDELTQLSHAYARVGNKYAPYLMKEHAPEVMAAMTTVAVVGPRVAEDRSKKKEEEREEVDDEPQEQTDRRTERQKTIETQQSFAYDNV